MADNVVTLKSKKQNTEEKVEGFMARNRGFIICLIAVVALVVVALCVIVGVTDSSVKKGLSKVDSIEYTLTRDSASLSDEDALSRQTLALDSLKPFVSKKNVVGVRANMLTADILFEQKKYEESKKAWLDAANAGKKSYTAPVCYFNAALCAEELDDLASAAELYEKAASAPDFLLVTHALFSQGRVLETSSKTAEALEVYKTLVEKYSGDSWANLAQSRIIALEIASGTDSAAESVEK